MKTGLTVVGFVTAVLSSVIETSRRCGAIIVLATLAIGASPARAQVWDEQTNGGGDAGKLPTDPQITVGTGSLTNIGGAIDNPDVDIDMYCIRITDKATFTATFNESVDSLKRYALWLFDAGGKSIAHAEDATFPYSVQIDGTHVPGPGVYFVAIAVYNFSPRDGGNTPLFPPITNGQTAGNPVAGPIASWFGSGCCGGGSYAIKLTGATYHMPPTNGGGGTGPCWTYMNRLDFSQGFLFNLSVVIDPETGKPCLKLDDPAKAWPFVAAPISVNGATIREGAVMRIAAMNLPTYGLNEGDVLGEYISRPKPSYGNPSRTTVDPYGNIWITNRFDDIDPGNPSVITSGQANSVLQGSVTRVGLALGGTRWDPVAGGPSATSPYLKGPFQYCTCEDRNNDGYIKTSVGYPHTTGALNADYLNTKLAWPSSGLTSGVSTAEDECITAWTRVNASGTRHVSIDKNNDVWVGGTGDNQFEKLDGATAQLVPLTLFTGVGTSGGYGGLVDPFNVLWSSGYSEPGGMLRFDTVAKTQTNLNFNSVYGIAPDPDTCHVWGHDRVSQQIREFLPNGQTSFQNALAKTWATGGVNGSGLVVHNGWAWGGNAAGNNPGSVRRIRTTTGINSGVPLTLGSLPITGISPHGLTVDANGKIWTYNILSDNTMRIDPNLPLPNTGKVDLAVDLGSNAYPYTYSDSSGREHLVGSAPQGSWTFIHDGGMAGCKWGMLTWSSMGTPGTYVLARVRAYDGALPSGNWTNVTSGVAFPTVIGRYLQVQITLVRPAPCNGSGDIKLCSLTICKEPGCYVTLGEILCPTTASPNGLTINATVTNNTSVTVKKVRIAPSIGSPVSFVPHTVDVTILPGKSASIQTKALGWTRGEEFCFSITLVDETGNICCSTEECITPSCDCLQVPNATASVKCDLLNGGFVYKFSFDNLTPSKIYHVYIDPPPGITFDPTYIQFPTGINPGASSGPITIKIKGASLGQTIPFLLSIHYLYLGECCARELSVTMPKSCFEGPVGPGGCCPIDRKSLLTAFAPAWPVQPKLTLSISNPTDQPRAFDWEA
ncbi:MAG: hypothetical protein KF805_14795, partial [Phycisphaeraceae bacterium]|nr:hypothetical protein [Phycisphaeraceae bacterium]